VLSAWRDIPVDELSAGCRLILSAGRRRSASRRSLQAYLAKQPLGRRPGCFGAKIAPHRSARRLKDSLSQGQAGIDF